MKKFKQALIFLKIRSLPSQCPVILSDPSGGMSIGDGHQCAGGAELQGQEQV